MIGHATKASGNVRRFSPGRWLEAAFWLGFAALAYAFTFAFDRDIEIYRFGAAGWPRAVIVLLALAALCQLVQALRAPEAPRPESEEEADRSGTAPATPGDDGYRLRVALTLLLPLVYAASLDHTGFYVTTPVFLAAYLFVIGERRIRFLILVPLVIYLFLLLFFTKLLYVNLPVGNWHPFYDVSHWLLVRLR